MRYTGLESGTAWGRAPGGARRLRAAMLLLVAATLVACADEEGPAAPGAEPVAAVEVETGAAEIAAGDTVRARATARSAAGAVLTGRTVDWTSSDTSVATVTPSGLVTARRGGAATITATVEGRSGAARLRVLPPAPQPVPVARVEVGPTTARVRVGATVQPEAVARDAHDGELPGRAIAWTTSNAAIATVSAAGEVTGVAPGTAVITATAEGKSGSAVVTVESAPAPAVTLTALSPSATALRGGGLVVTITGSGFTPDSYVFVRSESRPSEYVSPTEMRVHFWPGDLTREGILEVKVRAGGAGAAWSNPLGFTVVGMVGLIFTQAEPILWPGEARTFRAAGTDGHGNLFNGYAVSWAVSDSTVATIGPDGVVRALREGQVSVTATILGVSQTLAVHVLAPPAYDLVYESRQGWTPELMLLTPGEAAPRRILPAGTHATDPAASPDGSRIAYVGVDASGNQDIYVVNRDGSGVRRLTTHPAVDDQPAWSPDGTRIAFRSTRSGYSDIWIAAADGSGERNLTGAEVRLGVPASERPSWSPDGGTIVFQHRNDAVPGGLSSIMTLDANGGAPRLLKGSDGVSSFHEPQYQPDGKFVVVRIRHPEAGDSLAQLDAITGEVFYWVIAPPQPGHTPTWIPDASGWLAISSSADGTAAGDLYVSRPGWGLQKWVAGAGTNPAWIRR